MCTLVSMLFPITTSESSNTNPDRIKVRLIPLGCAPIPTLLCSPRSDYHQFIRYLSCLSYKYLACKLIACKLVALLEERVPYNCESTVLYDTDRPMYFLKWLQRPEECRLFNQRQKSVAGLYCSTSEVQHWPIHFKHSAEIKSIIHHSQYTWADACACVRRCHKAARRCLAMTQLNLTIFPVFRSLSFQMGPTTISSFHCRRVLLLTREQYAHMS